MISSPQASSAQPETKPNLRRSLRHRLRDFPDFAALPQDEAQELEQRSRVLSLAADTEIGAQGSSCDFFPLVLSGRARIFTMDDTGREITLYRLGPGEGCVLAATCAISQAPLPGSAVVEEAGDGLILPSSELRFLVNNFAFWRDYFFTLVSRQLGQLIAITNDLAFRHLDARIAQFLLESPSAQRIVKTTHQAVALEVGTRREVASRILKSFEREGLIALERGRIRLRDAGALARRAGATAPSLPH
ncbi:MAG: Crp/Fnr family transcriptional regulator [Deltaproteobacteria bacterium]|nr:Crp/Fnr family transcriptional regulator [Deltaproteobacteria bacterium]